MGERRDNIEVRLNKDGSVDEIVIYDPATDRCLFHLEQMSEQSYWMRADGITQDLVAHIGATTGKVEGEPIHDPTLPGPNKYRFETTDGPVVCSNYEWEDHTNESEIAGRHPEYLTPEKQRRSEVAALIEKYGTPLVLQDIVEVYRQGRQADFEQRLIADLKQASSNFVVGDKVYKVMEEYRKDIAEH